MKNNVTKFALLLIAAVFIVSIAFAGAASAEATEISSDDWNGLDAGPYFGEYHFNNSGAEPIYPKYIGDSNELTLWGDLKLDFTGFIGDFAGNETESEWGVGALFGNVDLNGYTLEIIGLNMTSVNVTGAGSVGGIIGSATGSGTLNFTDCHLANCSIKGTGDSVGGLIGSSGQISNTVNIRNCSALHCDVVADGMAVGGLAGYGEETTIRFHDSTVQNSTIASSNNGCAGGLAGLPDTASFVGCTVENTSIYALGAVGGFVGSLNIIDEIRGCNVTNCIIGGPGDENNGGDVGGLVGSAYESVQNISESMVKNCTIASDYYFVGGLVGYADDAQDCTDNIVENIAVNGTDDTNLVSGCIDSGSSIGCAEQGQNYLNTSTQTVTIHLLKYDGTPISLTEPNFWSVVSRSTGAGNSVTDLGPYGQPGGFGVGSYVEKPTYVSVYDWTGLKQTVESWKKPNKPLIVIVENSFTSEETTVEFPGIRVAGNVTIVPAASAGEITIDANQMGRLFFIDGGNLTLSGNTGSTLNLTGGHTEGGCEPPLWFGDGGGFLIMNKGKCTLSAGANITYCNTFDGSGGGIYCQEETELILDGGNITNCIGSGAGGVCAGGCIVTMNGGDIANCKAYNGNAGGLRLDSATGTMNGGRIIDCSAMAFGGGVELMGEGSQFVMNGGDIINCTAETAGGGVVLAAGSGTFTMTGGNITGCKTLNTAENVGGGVYVQADSDFIMTGGTITGCEVTGTNGKGAGIYVESYPGYNPRFVVGNLANITGNMKKIDPMKNGGSQNNVYLASGIVVRIGSALKPGAQINVTTADLPTTDNPVNITNETIDASASFFASDHPGYAVNYNTSANTVQLSLKSFNISYIQPEAGGSISTTPTTALYNATVTVDVTTDSGYTFKGLEVTENGSTTTVELSDTYSFRMPAFDVNVTAVFEKNSQPTPYTPSHSKQTGSTVILQEGQSVPTVTPTVKPTAEPTQKPAGNSTILPTTVPTQPITSKSPAPFVGLLAGLGAAVLFLRLRK